MVIPGECFLIEICNVKMDGDGDDADRYGGDDDGDGCDGRSVACASDAIWIDTG